jgi:hypothetical protein
MRIKFSLLTWRLRDVYYTNLAAVITACAYVALRWEPHNAMDLWPWLFILVHSGKVAYDLGRIRSADFAYLHCRGFRRETLWAYTMLAAAVSALFVLIPVAVIIAVPIRSAFHDAAGNPYFPIFYAVEWRVLLPWALAYVLPLAFFSYAWIRRAQPTRGGAAGLLLCFVVVCVWPHPIAPSMTLGSRIAFMALLFLVLCATGRALYRSLEASQK